MTIDQLRVFCMVARRLNLSAIAAELGFTQSAISQQIIALEKSMNVKLFDRVGRRLELAHAGEELLELSEPFVRQLDGLQHHLRNAKNAVQGRLVVGASSTWSGARASPTPGRRRPSSSSSASQSRSRSSPLPEACISGANQPWDRRNGPP